jgi:hypothetical protein
VADFLDGGLGVGCLTGCGAFANGGSSAYRALSLVTGVATITILSAEFASSDDKMGSNPLFIAVMSVTRTSRKIL